MRYRIKRNQLSNKPIGCIIGSKNDDGRYSYKNIVSGYINDVPVLIKTNLSQELWNMFQLGQLSKKELERHI